MLRFSLEREPCRWPRIAPQTVPPATPWTAKTFLQSHMKPAGPAAGTFAPAVDKLLAQMTLKEKVGQMTQLTIETIVDGKDQDVHINPEKLHKAIAEYGVGSILNVYDQALSV